MGGWVDGCIEEFETELRFLQAFKESGFGVPATTK